MSASVIAWDIETVPDLKGFAADCCPLYPRKRTSAKRFDELPKLDCFLRAGAVSIISIPFALRCATACAMHPANTKASHRRRTTWLSCPL